jgi:glycosyltransferase involved in cell wall biosynthesis
MLGSFPPLRGLSSYCLALSMALAELITVEFVSFKKMYPQFLYPGGELSDDPTFPEIHHRHLHVKRRLTWYNPFSWLTAGLSTQADLLHAQWWSLPLFAAYGCICLLFKLRGKPVVLTVHNVLCHDRSALYKLASRFLFKLGDHFIVHTPLNRSQLSTHYGIPLQKISVIAHGRLDFQVPSSVDRAAIRRQLGFKPQHRVILFFGAIRSYKGLDTALNAFGSVLRHHPTARLLIAGKLWEKWAPYAKLIEKLAISDSVVTHLNYIHSGDVHRYFCAADLVVLPYHHFDSQSGVGATAVAFQKPMIVSNVGGLPELVGERRRIVTPGDPAALAEAIRYHFRQGKHPRTESATAESIASRLQWPPIARKTCAVYQRLTSVCTRTAKDF